MIFRATVPPSITDGKNTMAKSKRKKSTPAEIAARAAAARAAAQAAEEAAQASAQEAAIAAQLRLGVSSVSVAGKTIGFLTPAQRLEALEKLDRRRAARTRETFRQLDDGWEL